MSNCVIPRESSPQTESPLHCQSPDCHPTLRDAQAPCLAGSLLCIHWHRPCRTPVSTSPRGSRQLDLEETGGMVSTNSMTIILSLPEPQTHECPRLWSRAGCGENSKEPSGHMPQINLSSAQCKPNGNARGSVHLALLWARFPC